MQNLAQSAGASVTISVSGEGVQMDPLTRTVQFPAASVAEGMSLTFKATDPDGQSIGTFVLGVLLSDFLHTPPTSVSPPILTGSGLVGDEIVLSPGVWKGEPAPTVSYQWLRDGTEITDGVGEAYTATPDDDGKRITCRVTATNNEGSAEAMTAPLVITRIPPTVARTLPDLSYARMSGTQTLELASAFTGNALQFSVVGDGASINTDTGVLRVETDRARSAEKVAVTAQNSGGSATISFLVTVEDITDTPTMVSPPTLDGSKQIGQTLSCRPGTWSGEPTFAFQWKANGVTIREATASTFVPDWRFEFDTITCLVTARNQRGSASAESDGKIIRDSGSNGITYHVALNGNDANPGNAALPFATWQRAFSAAAAGDTIQIEGGIYKLPAEYSWASAGWQVLRTVANGTASAPIVVKAVNGRAVLDFSDVPTASWAYGLWVGHSHWHFIDLDFRGWNKGVPGHWGTQIGSESGTRAGLIFKNCRSYGGCGTGMFLYGAGVTNAKLYRCDAFNNDDAGRGNADGIALNAVGAGCEIVECRAWFNGDDGIDLWDVNHSVLIEGCWAFSNGFVPDTSIASGDGNGFKLGRNDVGIRHTVRRCIAFSNRLRGFDDNGSSGAHTVTHCTAYNNPRANFLFDTSAASVLKNNLSVSGTVSLNANVGQEGNSWQVVGTVSTTDFITIDASATAAARRADGSLPDTDFLVPRAGSSLVDRGVDLGVAFRGAGPDIGAFETFPSETSNEPAPAVWEFVGVSSSIASAASGDITVAEPAGVMEGDLEIVAIPYRGAAPFDVPEGWRLATQVSEGNGSNVPDLSVASAAIFYRVRGKTPGVLTFPRTGGDVARTRMLAYRVGSLAEPLESGHAVTLDRAGTAIEHPGVATEGDNRLLVGVLAMADNVGLSVPGISAVEPATGSGTGVATSPEVVSSTRWRLRLNGTTTIGADLGHYVFDAVKAGRGPTGPITATAAGPGRHAIAVAAFRLG